jgi:MYND finger
MTHRCKKQNCKGAGTAYCSACQNEWYCSVECQRSDWKVHKITCGKKILPLQELQVSIRMAADQAKRYEEAGENVKAAAVYEKILISSEYQFGDHIPGTCCRQRRNGDMIEEWKLFTLRNMLTESYIQQRTAASSDTALVFAIETRAILEARRGSSEDQPVFFQCIYAVEKHLGDIYELKSQHRKALHHRLEALAAAKLEGPGYSPNLFMALDDMATLHTTLKTGEGIGFAEQAYNLVVEEYGPDHSTVQNAAMTLIATYLDSDRFAEAGNFARINYELLSQSNNVEDSLLIEVAKMQVSRAWLLTPPALRIDHEAAEEAETLAREACDKFMANKKNKHSEDVLTTDLASSYVTLADVMMARGNLTSDVESVLIKALSLSQDCRVGVIPHVKSVKVRLCCLEKIGEYYVDSSATMSRRSAAVSQLEKALNTYKEMRRISTTLFGPWDNRVFHANERIGFVEYSMYNN